MRGVVVGRGCLGRPWLFRDLAMAFAGRAVPGPRVLGEVATTMVAHAGLLCDAFGGRLGMLRFRKHAAWYLAGYPVGGEARRRLSLVEDEAQLAAVLDGLDPTLPLPAEARRVAHGHTNGPRPVQLPAGWLARPDDPTPPVGGDDPVSGG